MNLLPHTTTIYLDEEQNEKLRKISFSMRLNKDSLINFWLSKEVNKTPSLFYKKQNYLNSFLLLDNIKKQIARNAYEHNMQFQDFAFCCLKTPIDKTFEFLKSPLHIASFQKVIHHFEDTTEISKWPNVSFRNLRNIPETKKSNKKLYVLVEREANSGDEIHSIYTSLPLAEKQLKDLQRGKTIHNYYGYHIDSYNENGGMDECSIDIEKEST